jgi:hypothetical protein
MNRLPIKPSQYAPHVRRDLSTLTSDVRLARGGGGGGVSTEGSLLGFRVVTVRRVFICRFVELEVKLNANASFL